MNSKMQRIIELLSRSDYFQLLQPTTIHNDTGDYALVGLNDTDTDIIYGVDAILARLEKYYRD